MIYTHNNTVFNTSIILFTDCYLGLFDVCGLVYSSVYFSCIISRSDGDAHLTRHVCTLLFIVI